MFKKERKVFENIIDRIVISTDMQEILDEFSKDKPLYISFLKDIAKGKDSSNYKLLKRIARVKKISDQFIIEQAKFILKFLRSDESKEDYYKILKVFPSSSYREIRKSWLDLIKLQHPDRVGESGLAITKKLNEAYDVLGNPQKRMEYDANYHPGLPLKVKTFRTMELLKIPVFMVLLVSIAFAAAVYFMESAPFFHSEKETRVIAKGSGQPLSLTSNVNSPPFVREAITSEPELREVGSLLTPKSGELPNAKDDIQEKNNGIKENNIFQLKNTARISENKYIVKEGDNLWLIARRFDTSVKDLKDVNNLQSDLLAIGDELIVSQTNRREVVKEDVLEGHAEEKSFQEHAQDLVVNNGKILESEERPELTMKDPLSFKSEGPGGEVALPLPKESEKVLIASETNKGGIPGKEGTNDVQPTWGSKLRGNEYVVRDGDNLWLIARKFDTRVNELKAINNLTTNRLDIGDVLLIPQNLVNESHVKRLVKEKTNEGKQSSPKKGDTNSISNRTSTKKQGTIGTSKPKTRVGKEIKVSRIPDIKTAAAPVAPGEEISQIKAVSGNKPNLNIAYPDRESLLSFVSSYVSVYKSRDIAGFKSFFKQNARENGVEISKILPSYSKKFSSLQIMKYHIYVKGVELKDQVAFINGDFEISFRTKSDDRVKSSKGSINWVLNWQDNDWKIEELNYRIDKKNTEAEDR